MSQCFRWVPLLAMSLSPLVAQSTLPPGSVDGALHPEQIPDVVAFRLFLGALRDPSAVALSSPVQPTAKQKAKLLPVGLSGPDVNLVLQAVQTWHSKVPAGNSSASITPASIDLDGVAQGILGTLQQQMSAAGFVALLSHVKTEKKHMQIIPVPEMSQHNH